jgi:glycosyltransferase involved in cell wall biosynthesis
MQSKHQAILRSINNNANNCNILSFPTHERYQSNLKDLPYNFYLYQGDNIKGWNESYANLPKNHILLNKEKSPFKNDMFFDIVLSQNKFGQFSIAKSIADQLSIPLINLEHTLPFIQWDKKTIDSMRRMNGDFNVFISEYSAKECGYDLDRSDVYIIHHGVDTNNFCPDSNIEIQDRILTVVSDYKNRNWCCGWDIYQEIKSYPYSKLKFYPVGDTPGISKKAANIQELIKEYQSSHVFLNTSTISPIPSALLEAMACGRPCVSTDTCMIPEIIKDGENGFLFPPNKPHIAADRLELLSLDKQLANKMGESARKTILDRFSLNAHLSKWTSLFEKAYGSCHRI